MGLGPRPGCQATDSSFNAFIIQQSESARSASSAFQPVFRFSVVKEFRSRTHRAGFGPPPCPRKAKRRLAALSTSNIQPPVFPSPFSFPPFLPHQNHFLINTILLCILHRRKKNNGKLTNISQLWI